MGRGWQVAWVAGALALATAAEAQGLGETRTVAMAAAPDPAGRMSEASAPALGVEPVRSIAPAAADDPCTAEVVSQPARPMWTAGAQTTQCGVMENDLGWHWMGMGGGVHQQGLTSSERYGITRRLDLTWALPLRVVESGGGLPEEGGITDMAVSAMYQFQQQTQRVPAMAVSYGVTIPTANPAKGFGSGYADQGVAFLASRDVRQVHFDFNVAGALEGGPEGYEGAAGLGLVMAVPVRRNLGWLLEADGGAQPGTEDRLGQGLTGISWALRPNLVADAAYTRAWTAGAPRQQFTMGVTWAHRLPGRMARIGR